MQVPELLAKAVRVDHSNSERPFLSPGRSGIFRGEGANEYCVWSEAREEPTRRSPGVMAIHRSRVRSVVLLEGDITVSRT